MTDRARGRGEAPADLQHPAEVMFRRLELALYGKADNTWERGKLQAVMALLQEWAGRCPQPEALVFNTNCPQCQMNKQAVAAAALPSARPPGPSVVTLDRLIETAKDAVREYRLHGQLTDSCRHLDAAIQAFERTGGHGDVAPPEK